MSGRHMTSTYENVVIRGAIELVHERQKHAGGLTPDECAELTALLAEFHEDGYVDSIELVMGFLEPGPEQNFDEVLMWLWEHLRSEARGLLAVEERLAAENRMRDDFNDFCRQLGEDPDPDAPFEFPKMLGGDDQEDPR